MISDAASRNRSLSAGVPPSRQMSMTLEDSPEDRPTEVLVTSYGTLATDAAAGDVAPHLKPAVPLAAVSSSSNGLTLASSASSGTTRVSNASSAASSTASSVAAANAARVTIARRVVSAAMVAFMCYCFLGADYSVVFQYHPIGYTIAFAGLMPEIVALSSIVRRQRTMAERDIVIDSHLYLSLGMKFLSLIGFIAITVNKIKKGKFHYTTWHGQLGLLTMIILFLQVVVGFVFHFRCGGYELLPYLRRAHKYLGIALLAFGSATMWLGMQTNYFRRDVTEGIVGTVVFGAATAVLSLIAYKYE